MSEYIHTSSPDDRCKLREALAALCADPAGTFVRGLAASPARWVDVSASFQEAELAGLESLSYREGFSLCNLKAHYVLDEDFLDNGTAFVIFALVGSTWFHVVRLRDQMIFVPPERWLDGAAQ